MTHILLKTGCGWCLTDAYSHNINQKLRDRFVCYFVISNSPPPVTLPPVSFLSLHFHSKADPMSLNPHSSCNYEYIHSVSITVVYVNLLFKVYLIKSILSKLKTFATL